MRGKQVFSRFLISGCILLLYLLLMVVLFGCKQRTEESEGQTDELVFSLKEFSVFRLDDEVSQYLLRGQRSHCDDKPREAKYPEFNSDKPLFGSVRFTGKVKGYHTFPTYHYALDESEGTGTRYNLLYFDRNCDLDLTNDTVLKRLKRPPKKTLLKYPAIEQQDCFDSFKIKFDYGSAGERAVEIMPRLMIRRRITELSFIATKIHRGRIKIGKEKYIAVLGHRSSIGGPFDWEGTFFSLILENDPHYSYRWRGSNDLRAMHFIDEKYYNFTTTSTGEKLFVRPYNGTVGVFEVDSGGRDIRKIVIQGELCSEDKAINIGNGLEQVWPKRNKSYRLPIGDYLPTYMQINFKNLRFGISENYHKDGEPLGKIRGSKKYEIKIREDKPYILDFTNKPAVIFTSPAKNYRIRLGKELKVEAVLIDPELDIMIRSLYDTRQRQGGVSLDPKIIITRADGKKVAEGVMPFG